MLTWKGKNNVIFQNPFKGYTNNNALSVSMRFMFSHVLEDDNGTPLQYPCLENPMDGGAWWAAVHGVMKSWTLTSLSLFTFMHWRRKWQLTPVFLPGESQGRQSLVGCRLWGRTESDMTETTSGRGLVGCFCPDLYVFSKNKYINSTRIKLRKFNVGADPQISSFIVVESFISYFPWHSIFEAVWYQKNSLIIPIYIDRKQSVWEWISRAWNHSGRNVKLDKAEMGLQSTILNTML